MTIKIGINGMGRIGRMVVRSIVESKNKNLKINHINNRSNSETTSKLIKYDSIHGKLNADLDFDPNHLIINKNKITFSQETKIEDINWKKHDVDYVFECTGKFNSKEKLLAHIENGAKKVIVSAPCKNADKTIVFGINHETLSSEDKIISNASCTTNCLAPIADVINKNFGINSGLINTVHAATNDQSLLDVAHSDLYRARAASASIIPSKTGAAKAIGLVIPELDGKLNGMATRVPVLNVSLLDLTFETEKSFTPEELCTVLKEESQNRLKGVLAVSDIPLVSSDFNNETASCVFDSNHIIQIGNQTKILAWYDNEWGFSNRLIDLALYMAKARKIELQQSA